MRLNEFDPTLTESLAVGDPVIITGPVEFRGKTGDVRELGRDGTFVVVDLYNYGPQSFQASDVSRNDYADAQDVDEGSYDPDAYIDPKFSRDYGLSGLSWQGSSFGGGGGEPDPIKRTEPLSVGRPRKPRGTSAQLPADPFGRTTGKIPKGKPGQTFSQGTPDERLGDKKYALDRMPKDEDVAEGHNDWSGSQGNFAGDKPFNLGGDVAKRLDVNDVVSYFGEKATILAMSKDRTVSRIDLKSGITQNVKTSDLKRVGQGVAEQEKVGNMDADKFDAAMARLKRLAGAGPLKTVYDPAKRVYRNVPTAVQPQTQPKK